MTYRNYDREGLDAQYNLRLLVENVPGYFERWQRWSGNSRRRLAGTLDVAYGEKPGERMDVFASSRSGGAAPVHVFIHGGYWHSRDKAEFSYLAEGLVEAGTVVVLLNYSLAPEADMDEIVRQNRAALVWLWHRAGDYGGDRERIFVSGHSAGGHLAAMMAITDWPAFDPDLPVDLVKGGCAISGIYDLEPIRLCYLNDIVGLDGDMAARNSPIRHIPPRAAPLILCVGGDETPEYQRQQAEFADAWRQAGHGLALVEAPGHHHFTVVDELGRAGSALNSALRRQMSL